jgi:hypothetical protein
MRSIEIPTPVLSLSKGSNPLITVEIASSGSAPSSQPCTPWHRTPGRCACRCKCDRN